MWIHSVSVHGLQKELCFVVIVMTRNPDGGEGSHLPRFSLNEGQKGSSLLSLLPTNFVDMLNSGLKEQLGEQ